MIDAIIGIAAGLTLLALWVVAIGAASYLHAKKLLIEEQTKQLRATMLEHE